jgi:hypothetical protein
MGGKGKGMDTLDRQTDRKEEWPNGEPQIVKYGLHLLII